MQKFVSSLRAASFKDNLVLLLCILVPVCLQIQITLFKTEDYLGLRINLTDILVPFAGIAIFASLLLKKSLWPQWSILGIYYWIFGLSLVLFTATIHTYFLWGEFSHWAIFNKIAGWFIILAIFAMGAWIGTNAKKENVLSFINYFLLFFAAILSFQIIVSVLQTYIILTDVFGPYAYVDYQISGFMVNRNAYAFLAITAYITATLLHLTNPAIIYPKMVNLLYALLPGFVLFNASRAGIIGLFICLACVFMIHRDKKREIFKLASISFLSALFLISVVSSDGYKIPLLDTIPTEIFHEIGTKKNLEQINQNIVYHGDRTRLTILHDTFEMVKQRPIFGSGLGSIMIDQKQKHGELINLMDSTPLWLWAETGIVGLLAFFAFGLKIIHALWKKLKGDDGFEKSIRLSTLFLILGFSVMCIFHEILYTRHLWFFLGFALALPSKMHRHE